MELNSGRRRRQPLLDERVDSPNLRDFLRVKQDNGAQNNISPSVTLGAILSQKRPTPPLVNRTLLDIIRDDPSGSNHGNRITWQTFKDKLRLRQAGVAWTSSVPTPASHVPISVRYPNHPSSTTGEDVTRSELSSMQSNHPMTTRHNSSWVPSYSTSLGSMLNPGREAEAEEEGREEEVERESGESDDGGEPHARMSLMALLAETDRQMGRDGSPFIIEEDEDDDEVKGESSGIEDYNCCVCMVRHKDAALIPCGHTFCRLCSRELWVQRGNCPLCNKFIVEILDIF